MYSKLNLIMNKGISRIIMSLMVIFMLSFTGMGMLNAQNDAFFYQNYDNATRDGSNVFISNGERYIIGNLGDGLLGSMDSEGKSEVLSLPEHGKYANQSFFVTHKNSKDHLRIHKGRYESHKVYFMMTDGSAECLYNFNLKSFANILKVFCEWIIRKLIVMSMIHNDIPEEMETKTKQH